MTKKNYQKIAVEGLEKLAFGKTSNILYLMFSKEIPDAEEFEKIDFSSVSEIKRDKDGGLQVKFVDRQSILEVLYKFASEENGNEKAENFLNSIIGKEA